MRVIHRLVIVLAFFGLLAMLPMVVIAPPSWYEQTPPGSPGIADLPEDPVAMARAIIERVRQEKDATANAVREGKLPELQAERDRQRALEEKAEADRQRALEKAKDARKWAAYWRHTGENWPLLFIPGVLAAIVIYPIAWIFAGFRRQAQGEVEPR